MTKKCLPLLLQSPAAGLVSDSAKPETVRVGEHPQDVVVRRCPFSIRILDIDL